MMETPVVTRREFVRRFMHEAGLTFDQACRAYSAMVSIMEDGLVNGHKITFGRVGFLRPVRKPPRDVTMSFKRLPDGGIAKTKRVFHLDERIDYKFKFCREFARRHQLRG